MSAYQSCLIMISPLFPALLSLILGKRFWKLDTFLNGFPNMPFILHVTVGNSPHVSPSKGSVEASSKRLSVHPSHVEKGLPASLGGSLVT